MDLHVCFALLLPLGSAQGIWSGCGVLLGPALGTCFVWALLSYNLGSNPDVSSLEHEHCVCLGTCDERICPSQGVFLQLSKAEKKERGWDEGGVERMMMMVDANMEM